MNAHRFRHERSLAASIMATVVCAILLHLPALSLVLFKVYWSRHV